MEQRDYLLRQVEQLGLVLAKIFSKLQDLKDNSTMSITTVSQTLTEELNFDIAQLYAADDNKLVDLLKNEINFDNANLEKLADIFLWIAENNNDEESRLLGKKSLAIYNYLEQNERIYSLERNFKIQRLINAINTIN